MKYSNRLLSLAIAWGIIILLFTITSLFDIVIAVFYSRFYSTAAFVVTFGMGGIFAAIFSYSKAVEYTAVKNEFARWSIIIWIWFTALLFLYPLSALEGGEYRSAFISFGTTLALTTLLFIKGKADL
jgi:hypothetical protein